MGEEREPAVIADAGPLIHLHEPGALPLLGTFPLINITQAVWDEVVTSGRVPESNLSVFQFQRHQVTAQAVDELRAAFPDVSLQQGELHSLVLCRQLAPAVLLTDDLAAREAAKLMNIQPVGSLGLIVRAFHRGRITIDEAKQLLEQLYSVSSLFVTRTIVDLAIEQLDAK